MGPARAVSACQLRAKANWAALVGGKGHYLGGEHITLDGMKQHVKIQATLPSSGYAHMVLIHKQASLEQMLPTKPFYLLDDATHAIPAAFFPMINRALATPILPEWAPYLWQTGRALELVQLRQKGRGQGFVPWWIQPNPDKWQEIVTDGLQNGRLSF